MHGAGNSLVLVTGGAGFIGCNAARALAAEGMRVVVSDWLGSQEKWKNLSGIAIDDVIDPDQTITWLSAHKEVRAVVHMGAISATNERDADKIVRNNIRLSLDLWSACALNSVKFIYASSASVYGDGSAGFRDSEDIAAVTELRPLNAYGWSKWFVDRRFLADAQANDRQPPQWVGLRFFNVYGPYEDHKDDMRSVVNKIYPIVREGKEVSLFKSHNPEYLDGEQKRDFVYVDDCVNVVKFFLQGPVVSGIYNVGSGEARSFFDLAVSVFKAAGKEPQIKFIDMPPELRSKYQYFTQAEMSKLGKAGFNLPFTPLEQGVEKYVSSYLATKQE